MENKYLIVDLLPSEWEQLSADLQKKMQPLWIMQQSQALSREALEERISLYFKKFSGDNLSRLPASYAASFAEAVEELKQLDSLKARCQQLEGLCQSLAREKETVETNLKKMSLLVEKLGTALKKKTADLANLEQKLDPKQQNKAPVVMVATPAQKTGLELILSKPTVKEKIIGFLGGRNWIAFSAASSTTRHSLMIGLHPIRDAFARSKAAYEEKLNSMNKAKGIGCLSRADG